MSVIDEVKSRIDIVDLVSETVQLRRAGKNYTGFCPFHPNSRTPAFVIFPDSGTWRCFGQCNEGGDIFKFMMKKEGWDFPQALHALAERAGVVLTPVTPEREAEAEHYERLRTLLEESVVFYRHHLLKTPAGAEALDYLQKKRGLTLNTIETFGIGYAPNAWDVTLRYFSDKGYSADELLQVGLVTERQGGDGVYDRFRHRVTFPIRDAMGKMTGFGARILNPEDMPKFINSPQTVLFDKGHLLYALDQARKAIRSQDQVVIVEGYLDVIALHQAGFTNVVSPMGTALSEEQLRLLKKLTRRIVLALDPDAAGQKATLRGLEVARQAMDHSTELVFDARGLLRHEARLEADLRVTTLPEGEDPDEIVLRDPQEWQRIVDSAQPVVIHVMETLAAGQNLDDPKVKSDIAARVLLLIEDIGNSVEREDYRQRLARLLRIDERSLTGAAVKPRTSRRRRGTSEGQSPAVGITPVISGGREAALEEHLLRLLLRRPEETYQVDRMLQKSGLTPLQSIEFERSEHQTLMTVISNALEQDEVDINQHIMENSPDELIDFIRALLEPMTNGEPKPEKLTEDLFRSVLLLRHARIRRQMDQIVFMQRDSQEKGDQQLDDAEGMLALFEQYTRALCVIDKALKQQTPFD